MPGRITELSESQIIADILADQRRLRRALAAAQMPIWTHDTFTAPATYQLTYIPYGINVLADNGSALSEGTDYTIDYTTGLITFTTGRTSGHVIYVSYVTTGDLTAASGPVDTGAILADTFNRANSTTTINNASDGGTWTVDSGTWGISSNQGVLQSASPTGTRWGNGMPTIRRDSGVIPADVTVVYTTSSGTPSYMQILVSMDPSSGNAYYLRVTFSSGNFRFLRCAAHASSTTVGSAATVPITANTPMTIRVTHDGSGHLTCDVNGSNVLNVTDSGWGATLGTWVGLSGDVTDFFDSFNAY